MQKVANEAILAGLGGAAAGAAAGYFIPKMFFPESKLYNLVAFSGVTSVTVSSTTMAEGGKTRAYFVTNPLPNGKNITITITVDKPAYLSKYVPAQDTWTYFPDLVANISTVLVSEQKDNYGQFLGLCPKPDGPEVVKYTVTFKI